MDTINYKGMIITAVYWIVSEKLAFKITGIYKESCGWPCKNLTFKIPISQKPLNCQVCCMLSISGVHLSVTCFAIYANVPHEAKCVNKHPLID